ncbi:deazaflavin-dependent oxidoreductase (nitroreductase family) [Prauserella isguenensis]|uniref:Deazaflavin-dependent oxidoreductase (Nitroreductase family) n=1 Tax=Prauserella isguenensis TaxID=1470180 RepID=A0A839RZQ9_9PSEU|nr:nitroreductase/quinone reductase family protein [Prauserella isguenensis]MBB3051058.1 deazaflavin-dependent oxidoreductase (nitroreductase family) [Prauserella isguenensis]
MRNPLPTVARVLGRRRSLMKLAEGIVWADTRLHRASRGRASLVGIAGLPSLRLITTGRRTGRLRENNLLYMPDRDTPNRAGRTRNSGCATGEGVGDGDEVFVVTGSNWGRAHEPAWALNLRACPDARVLVRGSDVPVRARELTGLDREAMWRRLLGFWPGYAMERDEAGRDFPIFVLTPDADRSR